MMASRRHMARKALMDEYLEDLEDEDLKTSLTGLWAFDVSNDSELEKFVWDATRAKLAGINDELLAKMKNAGSIETEVGIERVAKLVQMLDEIGEEFDDILRQRGKKGVYAAYDDDNTFSGEIKETWLGRLEKAIEGGHKLD